MTGQQIHARVADFLNLRDAAFVQNLFMKHANQNNQLMAANSMRNALLELGKQMTAEEADILFETFAAPPPPSLPPQTWSKMDAWTFMSLGRSSSARAN